MVTKRIDIAETNLTDLLTLVEEGTEVILTKDEVPLARMLPMKPPRKPSLHAGMIRTSDDFDEPLGDDFWLGKE
ncbi:MAG: toxin-antitoxin (TA) system antitoxin [Burkholderiales bacterium]|nr:toxin-antitoxin (TA) system antitoxin [Anaerolineae bacterium]